MISNRLQKHLAAAAAVAAGTVGAANAAVVTWNCNLVIPNDFDGYYINVSAQTFGTSGTSVTGWNINPYSASTNTLNFFASSNTTYYRTQATGGPSAVGLGTVIGAAGTFANSTTAVVNGAGVGSNGWLANSINYFGFRFDPGSGMKYGYGVMQVGANGGTRTLLSLHYEDSGNSITVVPAPGALALLGVAGLAGKRRRR
jgi:hypothetical protein